MPLIHAWEGQAWLGGAHQPIETPQLGAGRRTTMSTRGFIAIQAEGKTLGVYNHSDSYPGWLGARMAETIQTANFADLVEKIAKVQLVDESGTPTPEQSADLKARGFWSNVSSGTDWYSHLRNAQGSLIMYIEAGYMPTLDVAATLADSSTWLEWGYIINLNEDTLEVYNSYGGWTKQASIPFAEIRADGFDTAAVMGALESAV